MAPTPTPSQENSEVQQKNLVGVWLSNSILIDDDDGGRELDILLNVTDTGYYRKGIPVRASASGGKSRGAAPLSLTGLHVQRNGFQKASRRFRCAWSVRGQSNHGPSQGGGLGKCTVPQNKPLSFFRPWCDFPRNHSNAKAMRTRRLSSGIWGARSLLTGHLLVGRSLLEEHWLGGIPSHVCGRAGW